MDHSTPKNRWEGIMREATASKARVLLFTTRASSRNSRTVRAMVPHMRSDQRWLPPYMASRTVGTNHDDDGITVSLGWSWILATPGSAVRGGRGVPDLRSALRDNG